MLDIKTWPLRGAKVLALALLLSCSTLFGAVNSQEHLLNTTRGLEFFNQDGKDTPFTPYKNTSAKQRSIFLYGNFYNLYSAKKLDDFNGFGLTAGLLGDIKIGSMGFYINYERMNAKAIKSANTINRQSMGGGLRASLNLAELPHATIYLSSDLSAFATELESEELHALFNTPLKSIAINLYESVVLGVMGDFGKGGILTPELSLLYQGILNLAILETSEPKKDSNSLFVAFNLKYGNNLYVNDYFRFSPLLALGVRGSVYNDRPNTRALNRLLMYNANGHHFLNPAKVAALAEIGIAIGLLKDMMDLQILYSGDFSSGYEKHILSFNMGYKF